MIKRGNPLADDNQFHVSLANDSKPPLVYGHSIGLKAVKHIM